VLELLGLEKARAYFEFEMLEIFKNKFLC